MSVFAKFFKKSKQQESNVAKSQHESTIDLVTKIADEVAESIEEIEAVERVNEVIDAFTIDSRKEQQDNYIETESKKSWVDSLKHRLSKTRDNLGKKLLGIFGGGKINAELYEELETILLSSDIGIRSTKYILDELKNKVSLKGLKDASELKEVLKLILIDMLSIINKPFEVKNKKPYVIMLVGINGAGKTTTIGKLTKYFQDKNKSVILGAADTFRAAAREQLIEWGRRNDVLVISQEKGDPASVAFDTIKSAISNNIDIVIIDTAGRLTTQTHLMEEVKKIKRIMNKALEDAPHETLLILDSNIGQNALSQLKYFDEALGISGLIVTKLDGTAKRRDNLCYCKRKPSSTIFYRCWRKG